MQRHRSWSAPSWSGWLTGRDFNQPRRHPVKRRPGASPLLFGDFLMELCGGMTPLEERIGITEWKTGPSSPLKNTVVTCQASPV